MESPAILGRFTDNPNRPVGSPQSRLDSSGHLERIEADDGFTNQHWEPGDYRVLDNGDIIAWNPKAFFPLHFIRP